MATYTLQLKRNSSALQSKSAAITALKTALGGTDAKAGEPMIAIYTENGVEKVLLGIVSSSGKYTLFEGASLSSDGGSIEIPEEVKDAIDDAIEDLIGDSDFENFEDIQEAIEAIEVTSTDKTIKVSDKFDVSVNIDNDTLVKNSNGVISVASKALTLEGKDAIKVSDATSGKQVELVIATANKVLTQSTAGLDTTLGLKFVKASDNTADGTNKGKAVVQLTGIGDAVIAEFDATDLVMDGVLDSVELEDGKLTFTWNTDAKKEATEIDLAEYIKPYTNGNGLNLTGQVFSVKIKENDKYLTVGSDGVASKGIDEAITTAVEALDAEKEGKGAGEFVTVKVTEVDGKITEVAVTEKDIASAAALNTVDGKVSALETKMGNTSVQDQITSALDKLDFTNAAQSGQYTYSVSQTDGKVSAEYKDLVGTKTGDTNALENGEQGGLFLSTTLDCGTY